MRRIDNSGWWPALVVGGGAVTYGVNTHASVVYWAAWATVAMAVSLLAWAARRSDWAHRVWRWYWWPAVLWAVALLAYGRNAYAGNVPSGIWAAWFGFGGLYAAINAAALWHWRDMPDAEKRQRIGMTWVFGIVTSSLAITTVVVDALRGVWW